MKRIDTSEWKEFRIGDLFDIHPTSAYKLTNAELFKSNGTILLLLVIRLPVQTRCFTRKNHLSDILTYRECILRMRNSWKQ